MPNGQRYRSARLLLLCVDVIVCIHMVLMLQRTLGLTRSGALFPALAPPPKRPPCFRPRASEELMAEGRKLSLSMCAVCECPVPHALSPPRLFRARSANNRTTESSFRNNSSSSVERGTEPTGVTAVRLHLSSCCCVALQEDYTTAVCSSQIIR